MAEYTPNSHKYKEEQQTQARAEKKVDKIVQGTVKTKKRGDKHKLKDAFISEDASSVMSYIVMDVLVPTIKKAIVDIVADGVKMLFFGTTGVKRGGSGASSISYRSYYDNPAGRASDSHRNSRYEYLDITLDSRREAEEVLSRMDELIDAYDAVSVGDLYDLVGITGHFTDEKYGWYNLSNARVVRARDGGYLLDLPKARPLK